MKKPTEAAKLFGSRLSPFVEKVVRALYLKGVPFELVEPRSPGDFRKWNPQTGKMPVLEIGGQRVWDSTLILAALDARVPEPPLYAADASVAARQRFVEDWSDEALYWYVMALRWRPENADATAEQVASELPLPAFAKPVVKLMLRRQIGGAAWAQGLVRLPLDVILAQVGARFDELLLWLGGSPFLFAERVSAADLAVFGQVRTLRSGPTPQGAELVSMRPAMEEWMRRVEAATEG